MAVVGYIDGYVDGTDEYGFADTQARTDISGIKDGTNIDSFGDVETALDAKVTKLVAGGVLGTDGNPISVETPLTLSNGEIGLMFGNIEEGVQTSPPTAGDVYSALAPKANTSDVNSKFTATVDLLNNSIDSIYKANSVLGVHNMNPYPVGTKQVISSAGVISDSQGMYLSDFIFIGDIKTLNISYAEMTGSVTLRLCEFDGNKNFIRRTDAGNTRTMQSQTKYVRINYEDSDVNNASDVMLKFASDTDPTYAPPAMTNRELTERFIKVPFTIPSTLSSLTKLADYPTGYNASNSVIVSFSVGGRTGEGLFATAFERLWVTLADNEIQIFNTEQNNVGKDGYVILGKL